MSEPCNTIEHMFDEAREAGRWREAPPGPQMIAALMEVPLQTCTDDELLDVLAGWERATAWLDAQRTRALERTRARLYETAVRDETDLDGNTSWNAVYRQVETEISTALRWTSRFTSARLDIAEKLTTRLPQVWDALAAGQLTYRHAEVFCEETDTLTDQQARRLVDRLLPSASTKTLPGLRRQLRKACIKADPETANERAAQAVTERSVTVRPLPDGLAQLQAIGPASAILAMFRALDDTARKAPKDDPRTTTARRFDALVDFVLSGPLYAEGCPPQQPRTPALLQITMDLPTLLGLRDNPAELHGYGPLPAALARALAADADWQRFIHDPITGAPQDLGRTRRHPDADLRRWIVARDRTCLFPACYRPAQRCEPDHNPDWGHGGGTDKGTLTALCLKHHKVRHHGWSYQRHPDRITWTSPLGKIYERHFTEADVTDIDIGPRNSNSNSPGDSEDDRRDVEFDDAIWLPEDEDQRVSNWLPQKAFAEPAATIAPGVVEAFRLDDEVPVEPLDAQGRPLEAEPLTFEEEQELFWARMHRVYGEELLPGDSIIGRALVDRATAKQRRWDFAEAPPF
jgi:hypothetical protein